MEDIAKESVFDDETPESELLTDPFNPEDISIDKKLILVETCVKRLIQQSIILSPDFQRHEVWDDVRKSRLIESLMLKIPIPMFYVSADEKGLYTVVDGLQRLSSLRDFILGKEYIETRNLDIKGKGLKLQGLEFWVQYNGKTFDQLPIYLQNRINEAELSFTVINPGTPDEVKRNIFKRINTGGLYLTQQEIRNALYTGFSTEILNELSVSEEFYKATGRSVKPDRMDDFELVLRCIAFMIRGEKFYPKNSSMDSFLSDTMLIINSFPEFESNDMHKLYKTGSVDKESIHLESLDFLKSSFLKGMSRAYMLFEKHCFRRSYGNNRRTPINKALFEMWGSLLGILSEDEYNSLLLQKDMFLNDYHKMLGDVQFQNLISRDSWKSTSVVLRFAMVKQLINTYKR